MSNAPDEAERLLDELITEATDYARIYELGLLTDKLLPILRAGLAVQRLERAMTTDWDVSLVVANVFQCTIDIENELYAQGPTIPAAINAALDAAGVE